MKSDIQASRPRYPFAAAMQGQQRPSYFRALQGPPGLAYPAPQQPHFAGQGYPFRQFGPGFGGSPGPGPAPPVAYQPAYPFAVPQFGATAWNPASVNAARALPATFPPFPGMQPTKKRPHRKKNWPVQIPSQATEAPGHTLPSKKARLDADKNSAQPAVSRRGGVEGAAGTLGTKAGGKAENTGICCRCSMTLDQVAHAVAACSHAFCCACLLEQATGNRPPTEAECCCPACGQEVQTFTVTGGGREDSCCEMPRRVPHTPDTPTASEASERRAPCGLLRLPSGLLARFWPAERAVAGLRVCARIRQELSEHAGRILLVKRKEAHGDVSKDALAEDLRRAARHKVALRWRCQLYRALPKSIGSLGAALVHLDLSLSRNFNHDDGLAGILAEVLGRCKALAHLDLSANYIGDAGAGKVAEELGECKALAHLNLASSSIRAEGVGKLAGVLRKCAALAHLDLNHNSFGPEGAARLAGVLGECKALAHLNLESTFIGNEGAGRLAGVLGGCTALAHLDLSNNEIGDEGAGRLAEVLGECKALAHLSLASNSIRAEGAGRLAGVLGGCGALTHFDVRSNFIGAEGMKQLADATPKHCTFQSK